LAGEGPRAVACRAGGTHGGHHSTPRADRRRTLVGDANCLTVGA
jgi:hypothetical protein